MKSDSGKRIPNLNPAVFFFSFEVPNSIATAPGQRPQRITVKGCENVRSANWLIDGLGCWIPWGPGIEVWMLAELRDLVTRCPS